MTNIHPVGDVLSAIAVVLSFVTYLPVILSTLASLGALVWYCIRVYEYLKEKKTPEINND